MLQHTGMMECAPAKVPITQAYIQTRAKAEQNSANGDQNAFRQCVAPEVSTDDSVSNLDIEPLNISEQKYYQSVVGTLLYVSLGTRPDISYAISVLCRYMQSPTKIDKQALTQLLRYIKGSLSRQLILGTNRNGIEGYSDSSYADCSKTRRSTAGYVFKFNGGSISWKSQLQRTVALSTAEAEYMSLATAAQEGVFIKQLIQELHLESENSSKILLYTDNIAAKYIADCSTGATTNRSKHIAIKFHYLRQLVSDGAVVINYVPTGDQPADIFTKPLSGPPCYRNADKLLGYSSENTQDMDQT